MLKKIFWGVGALLFLLIVAVTIGTCAKSSRQISVTAISPIAIDEKAAVEHLAQAVRLNTVSSATDATLNRQNFFALHALLERQFPFVHKTLKREVVNGLSLLYTWQGSDATAKPILLMAHQDVVPIAPGTEGDWKVPPFSGTLKEGALWGRGSWDDKGNLIAQLEAVEMLVKSGFKPRRTVYLAYGADEEVSGLRGAAKIAALLKSRGVALDFVLDEGLFILSGALAGLKPPAALIAIAEKGYMSVELTIAATPGHSSMPPKKGTSAIALLSQALLSLENDQMPASIRGVARGMFDALAPEMSGMSRVALSNLWLFGPLVLKQLESKGSSNAVLRTTTALTITQAGNKENVLPGRAKAIINFRLLPGDTRESVMEHVRKSVGKVVDAKDFEIKMLPGSKEASKVAPVDGSQYAAINKTVREVFPDAIVAPGLMVAATDSVHFEPICDNIFKFSPIRATNDDLKLFHGTNERLRIKDYVEAIRFYHRLIDQTAMK